MTNGKSVPSWAFRMLEEIQRSDRCEFVLHIVNGSKSSSSGAGKFWTQRKQLLLYAYEVLDKRLFGNSPDAFGSRDSYELLGGIAKLEVKPTRKKFTDRFEEADIESIGNYRPDVLIRLGFRILTGEILTVAPQGIWSYHHADNRINRGGPAGFWEFFLNQPYTGVTLQKLTEALDDGVILDRSNTSTNRFSYCRNRNGLYWRSVMMLPRKLEQLALQGPKRFWNNAKENNVALSVYSAPLYRAPNNWKFFKLLVRKVWQIVSERIYLTLNIRQWVLLYRFSRSNPCLSFFGYKRILPPKDRNWADPFLYKKDDGNFLFIEEMPFKTEHGHISVMELTNKGWSKPKAIIRQPYHMSFPFLIEHDGKLFMIPETAKNNCIEYYECTNFPLQWQRKGELMSGVTAMDTVLLERDGTWFMFTTIVSPEGASSWDELHLFYADEPFGDNWTKHPQSPVVTDVQKARMAGDFFERNGELYRPSQNCSGHYGAGMTINRVLKLTRKEYEETAAEPISADWSADVHSTHTINSIEGLTIIDAQVHRSKFF